MSNYRQLFKATALLGGSQIILTVISMVRNKSMAILLGPSGVGLAGLYGSIITLVATLTNFGLGGSGIREVAEANAGGDPVRVARTVFVIKRMALVSSTVAALIVCLFCRPISHAIFGDDKYTSGVALMGLVLLLQGVSTGQLAILQGLQKMRDLVNCQVLGAVFGTVASVVIVWFLRERGVAWFLVAGAAFAIFTSWWFSRKIILVPVQVTLPEMVQEVRKLAGLGIALVVSGLVGAGVAFLTRTIIIHKLGMQATGQYQAAFTLSSVYVGFILIAMGTGLLPRLSGLSNDQEGTNRLLNEQTELGLLLAIPGVIATLVVAPWVLRILYSGDFVAAAGIVQWQAIGVFFRMISWPLWHLQLARNLGRVLMVSEIFCGGLQISLNWVCISCWGMAGIGISFAFYFFFHIVIMFLLCQRISGFRWSRRFYLICLPGLAVVVATFAGIKWLPFYWGVGLGSVACLLTSTASYYGMQKVLGINIIMSLLSRFKSSPS